MLLLYKMVLKLAFKTAFPYGFSAFFIDTRLVNRAGTASLVRSASAWAERRRTFLLRRNTRLASIQLIEWSPLASSAPPSRYNRPWRPLDWRNSIEVSIRLAFSMCSYVNRAEINDKGLLLKIKKNSTFIVR